MVAYSTNRPSQPGLLLLESAGEGTSRTHSPGSPPRRCAVVPTPPPAAALSPPAHMIRHAPSLDPQEDEDLCRVISPKQQVRHCRQACEDKLPVRRLPVLPKLGIVCATISGLTSSIIILITFTTFTNVTAFANLNILTSLWKQAQREVRQHGLLSDK